MDGRIDDLCVLERVGVAVPEAVVSDRLPLVANQDRDAFRRPCIQRLDQMARQRNFYGLVALLALPYA